MQIHRVHGRDLKDALQRAGEQYGTDALLLSHERMPDGAVIVAVADAERTRAARPPLRSTVADTGLADVGRAMRRTGCSSTLVEATLAEVARSGARGAFALDAAAAVLSRAVAVAPSPRIQKRTSGALLQPYVIAFVGATGVGKTTTLAKLAARLARAGRRVGMVAMDVQRPGAVEQLRAFAQLVQAPVDVAADGAELARIVARSAHLDCVLVDTTGRSPRDVRALGELAAALEQGRARATLETYLVVPATASRSALDDAHTGFGAARPGAWIVTKLDETREPAGALEASAAARAPVAFLCDGQQLDEHLHRADPELFADLLLRGRIA